MKKPLTIGIAGGSGSGKSNLTVGLSKEFQNEMVIFRLDNYFIDKKEMPILAGESNYDDPVSVDHAKLTNDIKDMKESKNCPSIVIVEGFLVLYFQDIRALLDLKIYLSAPYEIISTRRVHPIWDNYRDNVIKPMYEKYVVPSSKYADAILDVSANTQNDILIKVTTLVRENLSNG